MVPPPPDHMGEWSALLRAVARGDEPTAQAMARDLSLGSVDGAHDGAATVGAGLGFVQVASGASELAMGVARAARGCASCHTARQVQAPPSPAPGHSGALAVAGWAAVWARGTPPPCPPEAEARVCSSWPSLDGVLESCQSCHAAGEPSQGEQGLTGGEVGSPSPAER